MGINTRWQAKPTTKPTTRPARESNRWVVVCTDEYHRRSNKWVVACTDEYHHRSTERRTVGPCTVGCSRDVPCGSIRLKVHTDTSVCARACVRDRGCRWAWAWAWARMWCAAHHHEPTWVGTCGIEHGMFGLSNATNTCIRHTHTHTTQHTHTHTHTHTGSDRTDRSCYPVFGPTHAVRCGKRPQPRRKTPLGCDAEGSCCQPCACSQLMAFRPSPTECLFECGSDEVHHHVLPVFFTRGLISQTRRSGVMLK